MKNIILNRKHWLFLSCFFLLSINKLSAQSLSEKLGGIVTDFTILSGDDTLDIDRQIIIKRAKYKTEKKDGTHETYEGGYGSYGYGMGYGYQSFHFEFSSTNQVASKTIYNGNRQPTRYCIFHCYDKDGKQLLQMFVPANQLKQSFSANTGYSYIYSLNLVNIPIVVLDHTKTIRIEWQYHTTR